MDQHNAAFNENLANAKLMVDQHICDLRAYATAVFGRHNWKFEKRETAVADTFFLTWRNLALLSQNGPVSESRMWSSLIFATRSILSGKPIPHDDYEDRALDVYGHARCHGDHHRVRLCDEYISKKDDPSEIAILHLDVPAWLATLDDYTRLRAIDLATGLTSEECAEKWNVSRQRVFQIRVDLRLSYDRFQTQQRVGSKRQLKMAN